MKLQKILYLQFILILLLFCPLFYIVFENKSEELSANLEKVINKKKIVFPDSLYYFKDIKNDSDCNCDNKLKVLFFLYNRECLKCEYSDIYKLNKALEKTKYDTMSEKIIFYFGYNYYFRKILCSEIQGSPYIILDEDSLFLKINNLLKLDTINVILLDKQNKVLDFGNIDRIEHINF